MRFASAAVAFVVALVTATDRSYQSNDGIGIGSVGVAAQASSSLRLRPGRGKNNSKDRVVVVAAHQKQRQEQKRAVDSTSTGTERSVDAGKPEPKLTADPTTHLEGGSARIDTRYEQQQQQLRDQHDRQEEADILDINTHTQSPRIPPRERQRQREASNTSNSEESNDDDDRDDAPGALLLTQGATAMQQAKKKTTRKRQRQLRTHNHNEQNQQHRHATATATSSSATNQDILLIRGYQTNLCWKVDNGRYAPGTLIVLDDCDVTNPHQHFFRNNFSYDVETGASSWLFRPVGVPDDDYDYSGGSNDDGSSSSSDARPKSTTERKNDDSNDDDDDVEETASAMSTTAARSTAAAASPTHDLHVVGHKYIPTDVDGTKPAQWRMVLDELEYGVTQPLTQVFWTLGANTGSDEEGDNNYDALGGDIDIDLMGMGQHAYSTRLFVTNEGSAAERDAPVVLRTEKNIYEAQRSLLKRKEEEDEDQVQQQQQQLERVYQLNGRDEEDAATAMHTASTSETVHSAPSVIPGKWSYVYVGR